LLWSPPRHTNVLSRARQPDPVADAEVARIAGLNHSDRFTGIKPDGQFHSVGSAGALKAASDCPARNGARDGTRDVRRRAAPDLASAHAAKDASRDRAEARLSGPDFDAADAGYPPKLDRHHLPGFVPGEG
jgi:hypothetical protein